MARTTKLAREVLQRRFDRRDEDTVLAGRQTMARNINTRTAAGSNKATGTRMSRESAESKARVKEQSIACIEWWHSIVHVPRRLVNSEEGT